MRKIIGVLLIALVSGGLFATVVSALGPIKEVFVLSMGFILAATIGFGAWMISDP